MIISWFSCGVTSAIATKITLQRKNDVRVIYIDTGSEHPDSTRFLHDCEKWFEHPIEIYSSKEYHSHFDVIEKTNFLNSPYGARCTLELKKKYAMRGLPCPRAPAAMRLVYSASAACASSPYSGCGMTLRAPVAFSLRHPALSLWRCYAQGFAVPRAGVSGTSPAARRVGLALTGAPPFS